MDNLINDICDFIVKTVQDESILSGFQYVVSYSDIAEKYSKQLSETIQSAIENELSSRKEVADVFCDTDGFDVVLYTDYAPNYNQKDFID